MLLFFFFNDTATTEIYTLSLHDALPICSARLSARSRRTLWRAARSLSAGLASRAAPCLSVGPGEDSSLAGPARDEVLTLLALEGQEADRGLRLIFYLLLGLLGAIPGGDDETALLSDDLFKLFVTLGLAGVLVAEARGLAKHVLLDLVHQSPQAHGQTLAVHELFLP